VTSTVLLLGDPVSSSLSPGFQHAAFMALGIDCRYVAREVPSAGLAAVIDEIRADQRILGANVTIPHKEAVIPLLDDLDPLARKVGAVNTISRQGARLKGWNTDVEGFQRALVESPSPLAGEGRGGGYRRVAIIGAGGAARAVAAAMQSAGSTVWIVARDLDRARRLCADLGIDAGNAIGIERMQSTIADADLVVNATPADLPPELWVRLGQRVFDLRYRLSRDGLAMLLHQGAAAFEIWTGRPAPLLVMRTTLERSAESVSA
jgi:shikimate dehydrogenase